MRWYGASSVLVIDFQGFAIVEREVEELSLHDMTQPKTREHVICRRQRRLEATLATKMFEELSPERKST